MIIKGLTIITKDSILCVYLSMLLQLLFLEASFARQCNEFQDLALRAGRSAHHWNCGQTQWNEPGFAAGATHDSRMQMRKKSNDHKKVFDYNQELYSLRLIINASTIPIFGTTILVCTFIWHVVSFKSSRCDWGSAHQWNGGQTQWNEHGFTAGETDELKIFRGQHEWPIHKRRKQSMIIEGSTILINLYGYSHYQCLRNSYSGKHRFGCTFICHVLHEFQELALRVGSGRQTQWNEHGFASGANHDSNILREHCGPAAWMGNKQMPKAINDHWRIDHDNQ